MMKFLVICGLICQSSVYAMNEKVATHSNKENEDLFEPLTHTYEDLRKKDLIHFDSACNEQSLSMYTIRSQKKTIRVKAPSASSVNNDSDKEDSYLNEIAFLAYTNKKKPNFLSWETGKNILSMSIVVLPTIFNYIAKRSKGESIE